MISKLIKRINRSSFWKISYYIRLINNNDILDFMPTWNVYVIWKEEEEEDGRDVSLLVFTCSHGRFMWKEKRETRERERKYPLDIQSKRREKSLYKREIKRRVRTYSSSYCLDIGALIFTTMYQLPSYDMITSIVSRRKNFLFHLKIFLLRMSMFYLHRHKFIPKLLVVLLFELILNIWQQ